MKYLKNLHYLLKHKYYVMLECFKEGLIWRGIVHDMSKFLPAEFIPYANHFFEKSKTIKSGRDETGYYDPTNTGDEAFDFGWLLHQKRNRHHWQWWILPRDNGGTRIFQMEDQYLKEMVCDWIGAGRAQGSYSSWDKYYEVRNWYRQNGDKMQLHPRTREKVELKIGLRIKKRW